jgi:hypothetical protein
MSPSNLAQEYYEDADEITCFATANVVGKTFVGISAARQLGGPNLVGGGITDSITGGNVSVATAAAGGKVFGVAMYDAPQGTLVPVYRYSHVMPVTAGAAITAGQEVQSDASGNAIPLAAGKPAGLAIDSCASGADAQISLYP